MHSAMMMLGVCTSSRAIAKFPAVWHWIFKTWDWVLSSKFIENAAKTALNSQCFIQISINRKSIERVRYTSCFPNEGEDNIYAKNIRSTKHTIESVTSFRPGKTGETQREGEIKTQLSPLLPSIHSATLGEWVPSVKLNIAFPLTVSCHSSNAKAIECRSTPRFNRENLIFPRDLEVNVDCTRLTRLCGLLQSGKIWLNI